ncbi:hypothetical protein FRB94_007517 [Tulasnella sp. JGI-2019a]|nr:hypothetical protein FRB93_007128 [Tulasnella sp. JGI-2019a]KAG8997686.1 hypothetical protein FRB94_007517 [Tulasnella sp. JGI-2019a]KAG9022337.1 hypothetical protein FRB95_000341 [Tulasnella sp. JGI-2019a]
MSTGPNTFLTRQVRGLAPPRSDYRTNVPIRDNAIKLAMGLTSFDVNSRKNLRVGTFADKPVALSASVRVVTWSDTLLYSGGCTWLAVGKNDRDFQCGFFSTLDDHPYNQPKKQKNL